MVGVFAIAGVLFGWYVYVDWLASRIVAYKFPNACVRCNSADKSLTTKLFSQSYGISFDNDALDEFFPVAYRAAEIPICHDCKATIEHKEEVASEAGCNAGLIATLIFALLFWYPVYQGIETGLTGVGKIILVTIYALGLGAFLGLFVGVAVQIVKGTTEGPDPVKFDFFGNISFENPEYSNRFRLSGQTKTYRFKQKSIPQVIYFGLLIFMILTLFADLAELSTIQPEQQNSLLFIIVLKILAIILFFKSHALAFGIWIISFVISLYINQEDAMDNLDDFVAGIIIIVILFYEWWQTRRDDNRTLEQNEISRNRCQCGQSIIFVREEFIHNYLTNVFADKKIDIVNLGYNRILANCPKCNSSVSGL